MKNLWMIYTLCFGLVTIKSMAQQSPCNFQWGQLEEVYRCSFGNVYIRVQSAACNKDGGICGWPKIAVMHSFNEEVSYVNVRLKGITCDGENKISGFSGSNIPNEEHRSSANWHLFKTVQQAVGVMVSFKRGKDYYEVIWNKETGVNTIRKNGSTLLTNGLSQKEQDDKKRGEREAAEQKNKEIAAQKESEKQKQLEDKERAKREAADRKAAEEKEAKAAEEAAAREREAERIADSISWAKRDARVREVQEIQAQNEAIAAGMAVGVGAVLLNDNLKDDEFEDRFLGVKANLDIGMENIPIIDNSYSDISGIGFSSLSSSLPIVASGGLQFHLFNKKYFRFYVIPEGQFGVQFGGGSFGYYYSYGGRGGFSIGNKIRMSADLAYYQRSITETTDSDALNESVGIITNSGLVSNAGFSHYFLRARAGFAFRFAESYAVEKSRRMQQLYIGAFADRPEYFETENNLPVIGAELVYKAANGIYVRAAYAPGYPFSGDAAYKIDEREKGHYFSVGIGKVFSLTKN